MTPRVFYRLLMKYRQPDIRTKMFSKNCLPPTASNVCSLFCHGYTTMASLPWVSRLKGNLGLFSTPPMLYITIPYSTGRCVALVIVYILTYMGHRKSHLGWRDEEYEARDLDMGGGDDSHLVSSLRRKKILTSRKYSLSIV